MTEFIVKMKHPHAARASVLGNDAMLDQVYYSDLPPATEPKNLEASFLGKTGPRIQKDWFL